MQAMWDDSQRWFTVDLRRVYVAGFSGTARMASLLAHKHPDTITGVIGAGAGFDPGVSPSAASPFLYFGTIGDVDYNFHELDTLERSLAARDWPHRIERFAGPHSWMNADVAMRAIDAGFRDLSLVETDASFQSLRATADYLAVVAHLRSQADGADPLTVDRPPLHVRR